MTESELLFWGIIAAAFVYLIVGILLALIKPYS